MICKTALLALAVTLTPLSAFSVPDEDVARGYVVRVARLAGGDYVLAGDIYLAGGDDLPDRYWYVRLTSSGEVVRRGVLDPADKNNTELGDLVGTPDGGFLLLGREEGEWWKVDPSGGITAFGSILKRHDTLNFILPTPDGGYLSGGSRYLRPEFGNGSKTAILMELDAQGNVLWKKTYDRGNEEEIWGAVPTADGGYIFAMTSAVKTTHGNLLERALFPFDDSDGFLIRCDRRGTIVKETRIPGLFPVPKIVRTPDEVALLGGIGADDEEETDEKSKLCTESFTLVAYSDRLEKKWHACVYPNPPWYTFAPELAVAEDGGYAMIGHPPWDFVFKGDDYSDFPDAEMIFKVVGSGGAVELEKRFLLQKNGDDGRMAAAGMGEDNGLIVDGSHVVSVIVLMSASTEATDIIVQKIRIEDGEVVWKKRGPLTDTGPDLE